MRIDQRANKTCREISVEVNTNKYAEGSCIISYGNTKVLCTASVEEHVPKWLQGTGKGWIKAEYNMLPRSTHDRIRRDKALNSGRSLEISRLISRSLRAGIDLYGLNERQIIVDCDVLQADGGTRTASVTGGFIALSLALNKLLSEKALKTLPIKNLICAVSAGILENGACLDLNYFEDSQAYSDVNFVLEEGGKIIEVQGTAEEKSFSTDEFLELLSLANSASKDIFETQRKILNSQGVEI